MPQHLCRPGLGKDPRICEYQGGETPRGGAIRVVSGEALDATPLSSRLENDLAELGLAEPRVEIESVPSLPRNERSAKLKRFIPLLTSLH